MPDVTQWRYPKVAGDIRIRDARLSIEASVMARWQ